MQTIAGSIAVSAPAGERPPLLAAVPAGTDPSRSSAASARRRRGWSATSADGGRHAAISGNVRWSDRRLQDISDRQSPADALLAAYEARSADLTDILHGSFALAVLDEEKHSAVLAVDRFGIEQMYWTKCRDDRLHFSTSARRLVRDLPESPGIDGQSVFEYLYFHMVPSPATIWSGVYKLKPGERLELDRGTFSCRTYWHPGFRRDGGAGFASLQDELFSSLREAVSCSRTDSSPGAFLSGGLDSSTVCGILQESADEPVDAFSVGFSSDAYNELDFAKTAAAHFGLQHHCIVATAGQTLECLERVFAEYDEPFGNSSVVPTFLCASAAHEEGTGTLLAGDGGDELFAGNVRYAKQKLFEQYFRLPEAVRRRLVEPLLLGGLSRVNIAPVRKLRRYVEQARVPLPGRLESYNHLEQWDGGPIFREGFLEAIDVDRPSRRLDERFREAEDADYLDRMLYLDWKFTLADNDLRKVTRMCELAGVDVEFPFLDERVVDASLRVPSSLKMRRLRLRHFYKEAMRGYLPDKIINKQKHGFGLPFGEWLKASKELQDFIYSALGDLGNRGIVNRDFIDELIRKHRDGHAGYYGNAVWIFMALEMWFRNQPTTRSAGESK